MPSALIIITTDFGKQDTWRIACKVKSSGKATLTMNTQSVQVKAAQLFPL